MSRISLDAMFMKMTEIMARRSSCLSRHVGCIIIDKSNHVLSSGFNGPPKGVPHCTICQRQVAGQNLDKCMAVHAEQNALLQCPDISKIHTVYVSWSPCITCVKLLMNTSAQRIVYRHDYPDKLAKIVWDSVSHIQSHNGWQKYEDL